MHEPSSIRALGAKQALAAQQKNQKPHQEVSQNFDVAVVGSGLAGLAAARVLALRGARVALLERNNKIGGHLLPFYRSEQVFEVGLHYIADCEANSHWGRVLRELKINLETVPLAQNFEQILIESSGRKQFMPQGVLNYLAHVQNEFPQYGASWKRFASDLELVWCLANAQTFPISAAGFLKSCLSLGGSLSKLRIARLLLTSAQDYFYGVLALSEEAAEYCLTHHVLIGSHPKHLSAFMYLLIHRYYFESPCFIKGGGASLVQALTQNISEVSHETLGQIEFFSGFEVQSVSFHGVRVRNAGNDAHKFKITSGLTSVNCRSLIWTPDPRILKARARFELPTFLKIQLSRAKNPHALCVGYFGTLSELTELGFENANYWIKGTLTASKAYEEDDVLVLAAKAPLYISTGSLRDPLALRQNIKQNQRNEASQARGVFQAMFLVPPSAEIWGGSDPENYRVSENSGEKKGYRRNYLSLKNEVLGIMLERLLTQFPLLAGTLCWKELGTPLTHHRYLHTESLGGYGFASTREDLLWARPGFRTGLNGLYLAGAHTKPSHGIVTCLLGGFGVGKIVAADLGI